MTDETHDILSALLDREPVDPERLVMLLERPEARALLVDFVRVRSLLHADRVEAAPALTRVPRRRSVARPLLGLAAATLLLVTGALVGSRFAIGDDERPPEPTRVLKLVPSPSPRGGR